MEEAQPSVALLVRKTRASSSEDARIYRQKGHNDAKEFALAIGLREDYQNNPTAKKDVIDPSGDAHSVKSGEKKWQIFLYGKGRFTSDEAFTVMNGIGALCLDCINAFPDSFEAYQKDKTTAKERLRIPMVALKEKLQDKTRLRAFLNKSIFNGGEVNYLTIKDKGLFHVFHRDDILKAFCDNLEVCNSKKTTSGTFPEQKTLLRFEGVNLGEIEMRNDSAVHYQEIRFNMIKPRAMSLFFGKIPFIRDYSSRVKVYGQAGKTFGRWKKAKP